ncbi:hypothetical protein [Algoriphagus sp. oki45]|uniref:hypothetical protein n=1 Tax=Algoriphagus sp. oki45 TaxID=3067294 RepID=UPI0030C724FC
MKKIIKIERLGNGKSKVNFSFPLSLFDFFLLVLGISMIVLTYISWKESYSLTTNILVSVPGFFGLLLVGTFIELAALNFRTLTVNHQTGTVVLNFLFKKSKIQIKDVSFVLVRKELVKGILNSNGFIKNPDSIKNSIYLIMKKGRSIKLIGLKGVHINNQNSVSEMNNLGKRSANEIGSLLSVKVLSE